MTGQSSEAGGPFERIIAFARRQSAGELAQQYEVLRRFALRRRLLVTFSFALGLAFLDWRLAMAFYLFDVICDVVTLRLLRDLEPARAPGQYLLTIVANAGLALAFTGFPAMGWLIDDPLAKSYSVGMMMIALIHHSTLRNVHLPLSISASITSSVVALGANALYWRQEGGQLPFVLTSLALVGTIYYAMIIIRSMYQLQADLTAEREAARMANLAKTRFLAQLSHELRTPLKAILGMGEAELMMAENADRRARMEVLVQSGRGLSSMLDDILDLSAVEAGHMPIRPETIDLPAQIRSTTALFRGQVEDQGMELALHFDPDLPSHVRLDGQRLRQCLSNVLSNAVKYGRRGAVRVEVGLVGPQRLSILVADNGPGVPEPLRESIFEPFIRGRHDVPGTGLGMSIARMLARRMGGDLELLPTGPGAHFRLTLSFEPALGPQPTRAEERRFDGVRVLVVDDIATNRLVAATYLRLLGAEAIEAASGAAGLEEARRRPVDVVLMDLLMPGMNGVETLRALRRTLGADCPPILAVSAESVPVEARDHAHLFDGHLVKPLSPDRLRAALAAVLPLAP